MIKSGRRSMLATALRALRENDPRTLSNGVYAGFFARRRWPRCIQSLMGCRDRHIDGHDYMWAVSEMLDNARDVIFIMVCASVLGVCVADMANVMMGRHRTGGSHLSFTFGGHLCSTAALSPNIESAHL